MKRIFILFLLIVLMGACKSNSSNSSKDSLNNTSANNSKPSDAEIQALIKKFKPIIEGAWVKADYIEKIAKTKSPLVASDLATWITAFNIDTKKIKGDSIKFLAGYGNHDSGDVTIKFRQGKTNETILFNGQDMSYSIENGESYLLLPQFDEQKKQYFTTKFKRISKKQIGENLGDGLYQYVNKVIVAGNYNLIDSASTTQKITFSDDGKLSGFFDFTNYQINIDLNSEPNDNLDEIFLMDHNHKRHSSYSFKVIADTLKLYETKENADSTELVLDKLKYKLVRQK